MEAQKPKFKIKFLKDAVAFLRSLPEKDSAKIVNNANRSAYFPSSELLKKLEGTNIWEFRTAYERKAYRLFAFWDNDEETYVVATHGIVKKTQKTPHKEIAKAETLRTAYFEQKKNK